MGGVLLGRLVLFRPRLNALAIVASLLPVIALTLTPGSRAASQTCLMQVFWPGDGYFGDRPNIALFVMPVLFAAIAWRRPLLAAAAGSGLSLCIEAVQALVPALNRACDANDWVYNTTGCLLGAVLALAVLRISPRRPRQVDSLTADDSARPPMPAGRRRR